MLHVTEGPSEHSRAPVVIPEEQHEIEGRRLHSEDLNLSQVASKVAAGKLP